MTGIILPGAGFGISFGSISLRSVSFVFVQARNVFLIMREIALRTPNLEGLIFGQVISIDISVDLSQRSVFLLFVFCFLSIMMMLTIPVVDLCIVSAGSDRCVILARLLPFLVRPLVLFHDHLYLLFGVGRPADVLLVCPMVGKTVVSVHL
jgi:hypothetical protein